jgi:stearoyl-CoA desaturase (delta-9 desaturase)
MTDFQRDVLKPALREEASLAGAKLRALLPRKLRRGLADDGRWLKPDARARLQAFVAQRPRIGTLVEHRRRLAAVLEARSHDASERLHALQAWCRDAEASGIRALQEFSMRLKGYSLRGAAA